MCSKTDQKRAGLKFFSLVVAAAMLLAFAGCGKSVKQKIVGKWTTEQFKGHVLQFTEGGEAITFRPDVPDRKEKYRLIDNETLEIEPPESKDHKFQLKINFTDDNTLNTTDDRGNKYTFKRQ